MTDYPTPPLSIPLPQFTSYLGPESLLEQVASAVPRNECQIAIKPLSSGLCLEIQNTRGIRLISANATTETFPLVLNLRPLAATQVEISAFVVLFHIQSLVLVVAPLIFFGLAAIVFSAPYTGFDPFPATMEKDVFGLTMIVLCFIFGYRAFVAWRNTQILHQRIRTATSTRPQIASTTD